VLRTPGHRPHVAERVRSVLIGASHGVVLGDVQHCREEGSHCGKVRETAMRPLRQIDRLLCAEQPFDEAIEFLTPHQGEGREPLARWGYVNAGQTERRASVLVTRQTVP